MDVAAARRVLGVEGVASAEQTRAAFHRASLRAHPDKPGGSHEAFVEVTEAYDVLRNGAGARGARARSGFASGEPWRDGAGGQSRGGDAPAGSGFSSGESHAFAWRFSSPDADAGAEASAERSARAREFERLQRARHAWEPRARDAEPPTSGRATRRERAARVVGRRREKTIFVEPRVGDRRPASARSSRPY
jgi:curved DNA-binding protein CbpA